MVTAMTGATSSSLTEVEYMADTGAFYTILPPALSDGLGIELRHRERVVAADNRRVVIDLGSARIELGARAAAIFGGRMRAPAPLPGVEAPEALRFKVNPGVGTLEPAGPFPGAPVP